MIWNIRKQGQHRPKMFYVAQKCIKDKSTQNKTLDRKQSVGMHLFHLRCFPESSEIYITQNRFLLFCKNFSINSVWTHKLIAIACFVRKFFIKNVPYAIFSRVYVVFVSTHYVWIIKFFDYLGCSYMFASLFPCLIMVKLQLLST